MIITGIQIIDIILYTYLTLSVGYLVLFAFASLFATIKPTPSTDRHTSFLVLIPSYKEDKVILETARSAMGQFYPPELFHVCIISDRMKDETNAKLRTTGAEVLEIQVKESSKALALQTAIRSNHSNYDYVIILDADNIIAPNYIEQVNQYLQYTHCKVLQTHRTAKNLNTPTAILDAAIEEMNNTIFRLGHVQLGLSSALIGSGMVMDYNWFSQNIFHAHSAGEDKELEELLLRQRIQIHYADHIRVLDEKVQDKAAISKQRRRWIATQFFLAGLMWPQVPRAILQGNVDYIVKAIQSIILPRSILIAFIGILCLLTTLLPCTSSMKWWFLLFILLTFLYIAIPKSMRNKQLYHAIKEVPSFVLNMVSNLFRSKGASRKFIHTSHG